jgi:hypothetical protein
MIKQAAAPTDWEFGYVLPNLVLPDEHDKSHGTWPDGISFGSGLIAIVRFNDPRVVELRSSEAVVEQILSSFVNEYGKPYGPAVLILRKSAPDKVRRNLEAIVAFRNAVALAFVLRARAAGERGFGGQDPTWSDTFDFHPVQIGGTGRMILQSPALLSVVSDTARLRLTPSPYLPTEGRRLWPDNYLFRSFDKAWARRYQSKSKTENFGGRLFRSLEAAYQACAIGAKNEGSLNEYGAQIALWVSAIEILAWPEKRNADLDSVLSLLDNDALDPRTRERRYKAKVKKKGTRRLSALQRGYMYLYRARNRFLHGNPVSAGTLLTLTRRGERVGLPRLAAAVYRAALVAYLDRRYRKQITTVEQLRTRADEMFEDHTYAEALSELFGYDLEKGRRT